MNIGTGKMQIGFPNGVTATGTAEGAINFHDMDSHRRTLTERFLLYTGISENLTVAASAGDVSITVANGATYVEGWEIKLCDGNVCEVDALTITLITGNVLLLDRPLDNNHSTSATAEVVISNANVDGTLSNPQIFQIFPPVIEKWHIDLILIVGASSSGMDGGTFLGGNALKNGLVFREKRNRGTRVIGNWKTNGDIWLDTGNLEYSAKAPAGENGMHSEYSLKRYDVIVELDGSVGDKLEILIQDPLSANTRLSIKAEGHFAGASFA